ncbi:hypothetical protein D3C84_1158880 [compost metagenome]
MTSRSASTDNATSSIRAASFFMRLPTSSAKLMTSPDSAANVSRALASAFLMVNTADWVSFGMFCSLGDLMVTAVR